MILSLSAIAILSWLEPVQSLATKRAPGNAANACESIPPPKLPGIEVKAVSAAERYDVFVNIDDIYPTGVLPILGNPMKKNATLHVCDVNVTYSHVGVDDTVIVHAYLPFENWNGRFQAVGGGGFYASFGPPAVGPAAFHGYAAASSYTPDVADRFAAKPGVKESLLKPITPLTDFGFANDEFINLGQWTAFASRGLHEMAVIGKAVTESFYGIAPKYSYYTGCSTGGRQGYTFVQRYPHDFDGVLANAPGIYWNSVMFSFIWPMVPMIEAKTFLTQCQLEAFDKGFISECDKLDGVIDGVVSDINHCPFDPSSMVGLTLPCDGRDWTITQKEADVVRKIHAGVVTKTGRKLWFGYEYGTTFSIVNTTMLPDGTIIGGPNSISSTWIPFFLQGNTSVNVMDLNVDDVVELFAQSGIQWGGSMGTDIADISAFRDAGGKLLTWHGMADENVPPNGTVLYRTQVEDILGGNKLVNEWYRVFLAPGVGHCSSRNDYGPVPIDSFAALVDWVEKGVVPETLSAAYKDADGTEWSKNLCPFPKVSRYDGKGDPTLASSYSCADSYVGGD
ncbi:hypothetical protein CEP51_007950 [Fusarium floridanum]|uniref:Carboxylic ester hydrolase n=1 Tax=Fusarium floridanum TaxID=1325733 RepID=A0A428RMH9_9HYPO|nr:hypothetical protein CEP51_007950 [Fusarium floridanum]